MKVKIAILEDEIQEAQTTLDHMSKFFAENKIEYEYFLENNASDFIKHDFSDVDLVLLDIIMEGELNGFEAAKIIREKNKKIAIIFLTKTIHYAVKGYEVKAFDYIVKPLLYEDFALKMSIFLKTLLTDGNIEHVFKCKDTLIKVKEKDILYIDIYKHYLTIYTVDKTFTTRGTIKDINKSLSNIFSRCSSNCIINLMHLDKIVKGDILINNKLIKITAKYKKQFLRDFSIYLMNNEY